MASSHQGKGRGLAQGIAQAGEGRLADRAYSQIVEIINGGDLQIGDRLPSDRG